MKLTMKEFQTDTVVELRAKLEAARGLAASNPAAVLLNAPTGSGKTLMVTALIDELLEGGETDDSNVDPDAVFVWLTDQPELNKQTYDKMLATSGVLTSSRLVIIDAGFDVERLEPGKVYFLNTQKLGSGTSFVKRGDARTFTLWETLAATAATSATRFVLIIDEAHRGAKGRDAAEAETIMQKFVKGDEEIGAIPLVLGISATPDRFVKLCNDTNRPLLRVDVDPELVRESGLLKEFVDLYHPDDEQPSEATMLREAISAWKTYQREWIAYGKAQNEAVPSPVLLVQVADAKSGSSALSRTDLQMVVGTLAKELSVDGDDGRWIAHAFQEDTEIVIGGTSVRRIAPSAIDADPHVRAVLFKSSLNTGWDCPRAETMVSFRSAKDETNIAQLVGRMVRAPLARRIDANEHLNTVALYLPYYDRKTVEKVIQRLTSDPSNVPPTKVREGKLAESLHRAPKLDDCFTALAALPTYTIPRSRPMKPVARLAKLAALLAELSLESDPVKTYRALLTRLLLAERARLAADDEFKKLVNEAAILDIRRRRFNYASVSDLDESTELSGMTVRAAIADEDIDDLYAEAGRLLGEGLHREYLRKRRNDGEVDSQKIKREVFALANTKGVLYKIAAAADAQRKTWIKNHKVAIRAAEEKYRQALREIEGGGSEPELSTIDPPSSIEGKNDGDKWAKHLYVNGRGEFHEEFTSSWEHKVVTTETARDDVVGWLRNQDRKPWSLCVKRLEGTKWVGIYPDFIFFRVTASGVIADIIDPHLLSDEYAPRRAAALAKYASDHGEDFGRIEIIIYASAKDLTGKRLDLMDEETRKRVASVSSHEHLRHLFESS